MEATKQNYKIASQIGTLLEKENCTIAQAMDILEYVSREIRFASHVQSPVVRLSGRANDVD